MNAGKESWNQAKDRNKRNKSCVMHAILIMIYEALVILSNIYVTITFRYVTIALPVDTYGSREIVCHTQTDNLKFIRWEFWNSISSAAQHSDTNTLHPPLTLLVLNLCQPIHAWCANALHKHALLTNETAWACVHTQYFASVSNLYVSQIQP